MPPPSRKLSLEDLAGARRLYEVDGLSHRAIAERFAVSKDTVAALLRAAGVQFRPVGRPHWKRPAKPQVEAPQPRPAVEIAPDARGRLRIPIRTREERQLRAWTAPELQAIAVELRVGRVLRAPKGRSGLPERPSPWQRQAAEIAFYRALQKVKAAA